MDQPLFLLLVFSGLSILPSSLPHQFHFVDMTMTWTDAQSFCRQKYTDLATIDDDMADMKKLKNTVSASWSGSAWIGLYLSSWRWSLGNIELQGEVFWAPGHPKNENNKEFCVWMSQDGLWRDGNCDKDWFFVCYDDNKTTDKYILIKTFENWRNAQSYCQTTDHKDLVSVRNATERDAILEKVKTDIMSTASTDTYSVWIGLHTFTGVWRKSDQSVSPFENWKKGEPSREPQHYRELCGEVNFPSGEWNGQGCTTKLPFICYDDELVLVSENKTWSEALWHCRDLDMELVSAHNQSIQHWVQQRAKKASTPFVWLGLRYTCTLDFWFWVNGEESCYHNWADREGYNTSKEQCGNTGAIQRDGGQWVGKAETERFNFICSKSDDY